jgi:hypothetical protein
MQNRASTGPSDIGAGYDPEAGNGLSFDRFSETNHFNRQRSTDLRGVFTDGVIRRCFAEGFVRGTHKDGVKRIATRIDGATIELIADTDRQTIVAGHVKDVDPDEALENGWDFDAVARMRITQLEHEQASD